MRLGLHCRVVAPLLAGARSIGMISVVRAEPRSFSPDEVELLSLLGRFVATAVENIRAYEAERTTVEELRRLSALRADFVSLVSHELRSPMATVIGSSRTLQQRWRELKPEQRESFLALIADETTRLATLIDDVLDTSRIEAGTFSYAFDDVDVGQLVRDVTSAAEISQDEVSLVTTVVDPVPRHSRRPRAVAAGDRESRRQRRQVLAVRRTCRGHDDGGQRKGDRERPRPRARHRHRGSDFDLREVRTGALGQDAARDRARAVHRALDRRGARRHARRAARCRTRARRSRWRCRPRERYAETRIRATPSSFASSRARRAITGRSSTGSTRTASPRSARISPTSQSSPPKRTSAIALPSRERHGAALDLEPGDRRRVEDARRPRVAKLALRVEAGPAAKRLFESFAFRIRSSRKLRSPSGEAERSHVCTTQYGRRRSNLYGSTMRCRPGLLAFLLVLDLDEPALAHRARELRDEVLLFACRLRLWRLADVELAERLLELPPHALERRVRPARRSSAPRSRVRARSRAPRAASGAAARGRCHRRAPCRPGRRRLAAPRRRRSSRRRS